MVSIIVATESSCAHCRWSNVKRCYVYMYTVQCTLHGFAGFARKTRESVIKYG